MATNEIAPDTESRLTYLQLDYGKSQCVLNACRCHYKFDILLTDNRHEFRPQLLDTK